MIKLYPIYMKSGINLEIHI